MESRTAFVIVTLGLVATTTSLMAQEAGQPSGQKTLAATVGVYVFPAEGQDAATQSKDEAACYSWAVDNTKSDPFDLAKQAQQQQAQAEAAKAQVAKSGQGAGAAGAVGGAAVGALVGEIASNDAGKGAAYGAAAGLIAGRRRARRGKQEATQQIDQQNQQAQKATAEQVEGFKKAFSACLEAKDYVAKI